MPFWIIFRTPEGRYPFGLDGPHESTEEAKRIAKELDTDDYVVKFFNTYNKTSATDKARPIIAKEFGHTAAQESISHKRNLKGKEKLRGLLGNSKERADEST